MAARPGEVAGRAILTRNQATTAIFDHEAHVAGRLRAACRVGAAEDAIGGRLPLPAIGGTSTSR
jgi:hypothetical protein